MPTARSPNLSVDDDARIFTMLKTYRADAVASRFKVAQSTISRANARHKARLAAAVEATKEAPPPAPPPQQLVLPAAQPDLMASLLTEIRDLLVTLNEKWN